MTPEDFYTSTIGKRFDMDGVPQNQPYQCVDYFKFACKANNVPVFPTGGDGYADYLWYNRKLASHHPESFVFISDYRDLRDGDFVVWAHHSRDRTTPYYYSHVAMFWNGNAVGQNQKGKAYVTSVYQPNTVWAKMLGAFRFKAWERETMNIPEGYADQTFNGLRVITFKASAGDKIGVVTAGSKTNQVDSIKNFFQHSKRIKALINGSYFQMGDGSNTAIGTVYESEHMPDQFQQSLFSIPAAEGLLTCWEDDASVFHFNYANMYQTSGRWAITPWAVTHKQGSKLNHVYRSALFADKTNVRTNETFVLRTGGRWVIGIMLNCYIKDVISLMDTVGATDGFILDGGGSSQLWTAGGKGFVTTRKIPVCMAIYGKTDAVPTVDYRKLYTALEQDYSLLKTKHEALLNAVKKLPID